MIKMPQKQKQKRKTKRRASQVKVLTQTTKQNVIVNIIKPTRKVRNKPYQGVPQIRRIEYVSTYGLGNALYKQPVINQPQLERAATGAATGAATATATSTREGSVQTGRTRIGTLRRLSLEEPPHSSGRLARPTGTYGSSTLRGFAEGSSSEEEAAHDISTRGLAAAHAAHDPRTTSRHIKFLD